MLSILCFTISLGYNNFSHKLYSSFNLNTMEIKDYCTGIQHVGIPTNDIQLSINFYQQLGFHLALFTHNNDEMVAFLKLHNLVIEIYENKCAKMEVGAIDHLTIDVKNITDLYDMVKSKGFTILEKHITTLPFWSHGIKYFTIVGPNREKIEFCEKL